MDIEFSRGDGPRLCVGQLAQRRRTAIYVQEGTVANVVAYLRDDEARDAFLAALTHLTKPFLVDRRAGAPPPEDGPALIVQGGEVIGVVLGSSIPLAREST